MNVHCLALIASGRHRNPAYMSCLFAGLAANAMLATASWE